MIVSTAIEILRPNEVVNVVGENVDLIVLLTALTPPNVKVNFFKPAKGIKLNEKCCQLESREIIKNHILFIHAFSGCDIPLRPFFGKGKSLILKILLEMRPDLTERIAVR